MKTLRIFQRWLGDFTTGEKRIFYVLILIFASLWMMYLIPNRH